jgi:NADPH2:quinone reductase
MQAVVFTGAGGNEVIEVQQRENLNPVGAEVLIRPDFAGLNPADVQQRDGNYPPPVGAPVDIPGLEVAGTVQAVGEHVNDIREGDRVFGIVSGGGLATQVLANEKQLLSIPKSLDSKSAAAIPEAFITAHDAVRTIAQLSPGDVLLVSGASGGVGSAAVQIAAQMGVTVIGTSRHSQGRDKIESLGGIACDPADVENTVKRLGGGIDVLAELVGGATFERNVALLNSRARVAVVGVGSGRNVNVDLRILMAKRARIQGTVLRSRPEADKIKAVDSFRHELMAWISNGSLVPVIDTVFDLKDVREAFAYMETSGRVGKTLLRLPSEV